MDATHRSTNRLSPPIFCHPETRAEVLNDIMSWVNSKDQKNNIMWLHGPPGTGKTTIARTIAEKCDKEKKLLASFFFSRTAPGLGHDDAKKLVPTIACQMMIGIPATKRSVMIKLKYKPAFLALSMEKQMTMLVEEPLRSNICIWDMKTVSDEDFPNLVIIDGLDECKDPKVQTRIIDMLASCRALNVRFLIVSRPELEIRNVFNPLNVNSSLIRLALDDHYEPDKDMEIYIQNTFHAITRLPIDINWATQDDIKTLVDKSSGLFIYASTAMKY
ncbi:P-loop containing nucleoside triphosphate hydrolase protein, partial [Cyathus striatus]